VSLQRGRPLSRVLASQVRRLSSIHVKAAPPEKSLAAGSTLDLFRVLTAIGSGGNTATTLAVNVAHILLQAGVGCAAGAVGNRAACVLGSGGRESHGGEGESDGESELHFG
jgi:hypothetical protein